MNSREKAVRWTFMCSSCGKKLDLSRRLITIPKLGYRLESR